MDLLDQTLPFPAEELASAHLWTIEQWHQNTPKLSPDQIASILPLATQENDPNSWKNKIHAVIESINNP